MLHFEMDVVAADVDERTIEGVIVPVRRGRPDCRRRLPIRSRLGQVRAHANAAAESTTTAAVRSACSPSSSTGRAALIGRFRIDRTPDGDQALAAGGIGLCAARSPSARPSRPRPIAAGFSM